MTEPIIPEMPTPPENFPFKPGEAVWYEPSGHSMTKPYLSQLIPATVLDCDSFGNHSSARIQRADKPRSTKVSAGGLMYRGFCATCLAPAIIDPYGQLACPSCDT